MNFLCEIGRATRVMVSSIRAFPAVFRSRNSRADFARQLHKTGIGTLPVVTVVAFFIGMILALQVGLELRRFNYEMYLGAGVMVTLIREMGPFCSGICLAACVGSAIAAEFGTMRVNDEIAALEIMSVSPIRYLAAPRILALVVMAPIVAFYCCVIGTVGGGVVAMTQLNVEFGQYMTSALTMAKAKELWCGLVKAGVFGLLIGTVSVSEGLGTSLGALGVGKATQRSVIESFLLILMIGYMISRICYQ